MKGNCPPADMLQALLEDHLADPERSATADHLGDCPACQQSAEQMIAGISGEFARLRLSSGTVTIVDESPIAPLVAMVKERLNYRPERAPSFYGRFIPGSHFAGRYRIVALLGCGATGEIYRADDLELNQPVALKLLSLPKTADPSLRESIRNEVRLSRKVTHPFVCRVHDIDETAEHLFLTMEYIEGENLASLLRRIDLIPYQKGLQMARQLCLGLAAAHDQGVIHRDLKPANVMIDLLGRVRINDFGLALGAGDHVEPGVRFAGTPAYAAPEQVLAGTTSIQSDLFSLGMVLYEIFLGHRVCRPTVLGEIRKWHEAGTTIEYPESFRQLAPAVQQIIQRCLSHAPADRPASADEVAEAFSDADPLKAAVAAGVAPSPDDLREAGERRPLTSRQGILYALLMIGLLIVLGGLSPWTLPAQLDADQSPAALASRAREILKALDSSPAGSRRFDRAYGFAEHHDVRGPVYFWYRESPVPLVPRFFVSDINRPMNLSRGLVSWEDPPLDVPGMVLLWLDRQGSLRGLRTVPAPISADATTDFDADRWQVTLSHWTRLDLTQFQARRISGTAPVPAEWAMSWTHPDEPHAPRLEASFLRGQLLSLRVDDATHSLGPDLEWTEQRSNRRLGALGALVSFALIGWAGWACWSQIQARQVDYVAVSRLGAVTFAASMAAWLLRAKHVLAIEEAGILQTGLARSLLTTCLICAWYAAIEYSLRKRSPGTMIGWTKLFRGDYLDLHVGRDIVAGVLGGLGIAVISELATATAMIAGDHSLDRMPSVLNYMLGPRYFAAALLDGLERAVQMALGGALLWLICRRIPWRPLSLLLFGGALLVIFAQMRGGSPLAWGSAAIVAAVVTTVVVRFGLLATAIMVFIRALLLFPVSNNFGAWFAESSVPAILIVVNLGAFGLITATNRKTWAPR